jgi:uncharacterized RDD family membrane protein YckC
VTDPDAAYADWYVWARRNLANDSAMCHAAAAAATELELRGGSREEAIAAARQSTTTGAHLASPDQADLRRRSYAEWFDWARRELGGVREQQHAAARAAVAALDAGQGANAAMAAARQSAGIEAAAVAGGPGAAPAPAIAAVPPGPAPYVPYPAQPLAPPVPAAPAYAPSWPPPSWPPPAAAPVFAGYAGFWRRVAAYLIDTLLLTAALVLVSLIGGFVYGVYIGLSAAATPSQKALSSALQLPVDGAVLVGGWLYFTLLEASPWQATVGKLALGIRVSDLAGGRIGWGRANARYFAKILSALILGIGYLMAAFTERKQALHDMIAATLVVRRP